MLNKTKTKIDKKWFVATVTTITAVTTVTTVATVPTVTNITNVALVGRFKLPFDTLKVTFSQRSLMDGPTDGPTDGKQHC